MRYFIGLELDPALKEHLANVQEKLRAEFPAVKWVATDQVHLTVKFLGNIHHNLGMAKKLLREISSHVAPFTFTLSHAGCFPENDPVRTIWVGVEDRSEMLGRFQRECEAEFVAKGFVAEEREFVPHITVGRIPSKNPKSALRKRVVQIPPNHLLQEVREAALIQSKLTKDGAEYQVVLRAPFTASIVS